MFDIELNSFIVKFQQLRSAGRYAHLDLHCEGGQSFVSLRVQLGEAGQQPHHRHHQQVRRGLRRSPAYHRRQERRKAARQAAEAEDATPPVPAPEVETAEVPAVDVPAPEEPTVESPEPNFEFAAPAAVDTSSTEKVESPPPPQIVSESEAEAPEWFKEHLRPDVKLHGNTKVVVSDQLLGIIRPGLEVQRDKGEKFSLAQIVKNLWSYICTRGGYSPGSDYFSADESLAKVFRSERVEFSAMKKKFQHHVYHGGKNIYTGFDIGDWYCQYFDITFDNLT